MGLSDLGISSEDERVYRFFLREPDADVAKAVRTLKVPRPQIVAAVGRLAALRLLAASADAVRIVAGNPQEALERLIARRLLEVNEELRRISVSREVIASLDAEMTASPMEMVERLDGGDRATKRFHEIRDAAAECLTVRPMTTGTSAFDLPLTQTRVGGGHRYRTIVHRSLLGVDPEIDGHLHDYHRAGARVRVVDEPLQMLMIFDRSVAMVPIHPGNTPSGALLIRQPGMVATLVSLFDQAWARAVDLEPVDDGDLTLLERRVLDLLICMDKDESAAREMGISVRTFRRHVAGLMARLGATNRFQAAYLARDRGWI